MCPKNNQEKKEAASFDIAKTLEGKTTNQLKEIVGVNKARQKRIQAQTALFAANTGQIELLPTLEELTHSPSTVVKEHALWAIEKLKESK